MSSQSEIVQVGVPLVHDFLLEHGFNKAAKCLQKEYKEDIKPAKMSLTELLLKGQAKRAVTSAVPKKSAGEGKKKSKKADLPSDTSDSDSDSSVTSTRSSSSATSATSATSDGSSSSSSSSSSSASSSSSSSASSTSSSSSSSSASSSSESSDSSDSSASESDEFKTPEKPAAKKQKLDTSEISKTHGKSENDGEARFADGSASGQKPGERFRRVKEEEVSFESPELMKMHVYDGKDGFGSRANELLRKTKGASFLKGKNKMKKSGYRGGKIDAGGSHSYKFYYDDAI
jgi:hypothetical protein